MSTIAQELLDHLETGIEILVLLQYNAAPLLTTLNCSECTAEDCTSNGCALGLRPIEYMEEPMYINFTHKEYYNCPISIIHPIVYLFNDRYMFLKEFNSQLVPGETSSLFWWYVKTYNRFKEEVQEKKREEHSKGRGR